MLVTQFKAWGDTQIAAAKQAFENAIDGSRANAQDGITAKANTDQAAATKAINEAGVNEKSQTESAIKGKLGEHIASLQAALGAFMLSIGEDFDKLVIAENSQTTTDLNSQYTTLSANITTALNAAKAANVQDVTEQSLLVKGQATSDLIKEINRVKQALTDEIANQQTTAQGEVNDYLAAEVTRINSQLDTLVAGLEAQAKNEIAAAGQAVEDSAIANFDRVIDRIGVETPITVDPQKLHWNVLSDPSNKKVTFKVTNSNEFDVVFRYKFVSDGGEKQAVVSETPYAQSAAKPGETTLNFDVDQIKKLFGLVTVDKGGTIEAEWLDENGTWVICWRSWPLVI